MYILSFKVSNEENKKYRYFLNTKMGKLNFFKNLRANLGQNLKLLRHFLNTSLSETHYKSF